MMAFSAKSWVFVVSALAMLVGARQAMADDASLALVCLPADAITISLAAALPPDGELLNTTPHELIVKKIHFEVHSESGGFWIQLKQPVLPRMTFNICEILEAAGIDSVDLDAARFFVEGKMIGTGDPLDVEGRCENFPLPRCPLSE